MKKRLIGFILVIMLAIGVIPSAYAEPNNSHTFPLGTGVHGGASQSICSLVCSDEDSFGIRINYIYVPSGETHISYRPWCNGKKLLKHPVDVYNSTTYSTKTIIPYNYNKSYVSLNDYVIMKASITTSDTSVYAYFGGALYA